MPCKKSELASAITSYGSARTTSDGNLIAMSIDLVKQLMDTLEYAPEENEVQESEPV